MGEHDQRPATAQRGRAWLPPRWFIKLFWRVHLALVRATRGRLGLWRPNARRGGTLWLISTGRRSGQPRHVLLAYLNDGNKLFTMAMNGWAPAEPAWWLNLQAHPDCTVQTRDGLLHVRARPSQGTERELLWSRWAQVDKRLDDYAARRPGETAVVVFEPHDAGG